MIPLFVKTITRKLRRRLCFWIVKKLIVYLDLSRWNKQEEWIGDDHDVVSRIFRSYDP